MCDYRSITQTELDHADAYEVEDSKSSIPASEGVPQHRVSVFVALCGCTIVVSMGGMSVWMIPPLWLEQERGWTADEYAGLMLLQSTLNTVSIMAQPRLDALVLPYGASFRLLPAAAGTLLAATVSALLFMGDYAWQLRCVVLICLSMSLALATACIMSCAPMYLTKAWSGRAYGILNTAATVGMLSANLVSMRLYHADVEAGQLGSTPFLIQSALLFVCSVVVGGLIYGTSTAIGDLPQEEMKHVEDDDKLGDGSHHTQVILDDMAKNQAISELEPLASNSK